MPRTEVEIQADIDALKAQGLHPAKKEFRDLRAELLSVAGASSPSAPPAPAFPSVPVPFPPQAAPAEPFLASDDVAFVNEALAQMVLKGKIVGNVERCYSDIRGLLLVKHLVEDAVGLKLTGRIKMPEYGTLGRERDSGEFFKPGENQLVVDGLAQRAVPPPRTASKPSMTNPDGTPLRLPRTRIDEPEGNASFVTSGAESAE